MFKNKLNVVIAINALLLVVIFVLCVLKSAGTEKIVYVDNAKLFDGFRMTAEMKATGEQEFNKRQSLMDTLYNKLQSHKVSGPEKEMLTRQLMTAREDLENFNRQFASEEGAKIWSRIGSYIKEYSAENDIEMIIGSDNMRSVWYAKPEKDATAQVLNYINKKYEGIK